MNPRSLTSITGGLSFGSVTSGIYDSNQCVALPSLDHPPPWKVLWTFTPRNLGTRKSHSKPHFRTPGWTRAWRLVSQSRRRECFLWVGTAESWRESDATIAPLHFLFRILDPYSSITSLGPKLPFWPTRPFNVGVSLTLDPTIDPP